MGTWSAAIFGNDTSCDTKDEFFKRYNNGEEPEDIKNDLLPAEDDDDRYDVLFSLAYCLWEVGGLKDDFLAEVKEVVLSGKDIEIARELGADDKFINKRITNLAEFLEKISVKKEKPKKRVAPPVPVESKYKNGAVMAFKYEDGMWGACSGGICKAFDYSVKTAEEFKTYAAWILTNAYNKGIFAHTDMTVDEIDKEFIERLSR